MKIPKYKRHKKIGEPPGTVTFVGEKKIDKPRVTLIEFDDNHVEEKFIESFDECMPYIDKNSVIWLNIEGLHDVELIGKIGKCFDIHPLILEDIVNTDHLPKIDYFENYIFIVLKNIIFDEQSRDIKSEQICLILGTNYVISFQESNTGIFNYIRERLFASKGKIKQLGADYLNYTLLDAIVDNYFLVLEKIDEDIDTLEEELIQSPTSNTLSNIHKLKRGMIYLRKSVWPLREVIRRLDIEETELIENSTAIYIKDLYEHIIQVIETLEFLRDILSNLMDVYMSSISNKMNEVMKVLTIIATIFIPLTFIAGVYGMNFKFMPELEWRWGYPAIIIFMALIFIGMLFYFKRKKWI
ncbi:MAG: magnesium transporter [Bacteroidota bacterium]|nr:magnesium transporter [Bacteroidota bacterium]